MPIVHPPVSVPAASATIITAATLPRNAWRCFGVTVVLAMMASSWARGTALIMAISDGPSARSMSFAASERLLRRIFLNSGSIAAFFTRTSIPRGISVLPFILLPPLFLAR
jgi:hypothetical protein